MAPPPQFAGGGAQMLFSVLTSAAYCTRNIKTLLKRITRDVTNLESLERDSPAIF